MTDPLTLAHRRRASQVPVVGRPAVGEPREFLVGANHVTVLGHERTIARATGRTFECAWVHVWQLREGRLARFFGMLDSEAAAAARAR